MRRASTALEGAARGSLLLGAARELVRLAGQRELPNDQRLPEYRETQLEELKTHVLSPAAMFPGVEEAFVKEWLVAGAEGARTEKDPPCKQVLAGRTPERRGARPGGVDEALRRVRPQGAVGGRQTGGRGVDGSARGRPAHPRAGWRWRSSSKTTTAWKRPMRVEGQRIAEASFAVHGTNIAPDATFTLRLSVGVVKGYTWNGKTLPWATDFAGLYKHTTGAEPLKLPKRWLDAQARLNPKTPLNLVSTNDIIGGNSGSPLVGATGDIVGLIFDGNLPSLPERFVYQDTTARAVSVDTAGMLEALRVVYGADALADELAPR